MLVANAGTVDLYQEDSLEETQVLLDSVAETLPIDRSLLDYPGIDLSYPATDCGSTVIVIEGRMVPISMDVKLRVHKETKNGK
jgi:hypothetical protein